MRARAVSGVKWLASSTTVTVGVGFLQTVVLGRLLEPRDFGVMAMAWTWLGFLQAFSDLGVGNAIIQRQDQSLDRLSTVYWTTVASGIAVALLVVASTPVLVLVYREPAIESVMPWIAAAFVVQSIGQPFRLMLQRELQFQSLAVAESTAAVAGACVAITAAWHGVGVLSLVFGGLCTATWKTCYLIGRSWTRWRPQLRFRRSDLAGYLSFGAYQMGERVANYASANVDYVMVGVFLGVEQLGLYRLAYEIAVRPLTTITPVLNTVAFPVFARKQDDDEALRRGYLQLVRLIGLITFPLMAGIAAIAPVAIPAALGERWRDAAPLLQILAVTGALKALMNPVGSLLLAKGRVELAFVLTVIFAIAATAGFWLAAHVSAVAVAWCWLALSVAYFLGSWEYLYARTIRLGRLEYARAVLPSAICSITMGLCVHGLMRWLQRLSLTDLWQTLLLVPMGAAVYIGLQLAVNRPEMKMVWELARGRAADRA